MMPTYKIIGVLLFIVGFVFAILGPVLFFTTNSSWVTLVLWPLGGFFDMWVAKDVWKD